MARCAECKIELSALGCGCEKSAPQQEGFKPRPEGFDYSTPDKERRCEECNSHGMNRTGLRPVGYIGASTTGMYAVRCSSNCYYGLTKMPEQKESV